MMPTSIPMMSHHKTNKIYETTVHNHQNNRQHKNYKPSEMRQCQSKSYNHLSFLPGDNFHDPGPASKSLRRESGCAKLNRHNSVQLIRLNSARQKVQKSVQGPPSPHQVLGQGTGCTCAQQNQPRFKTAAEKGIEGSLKSTGYTLDFPPSQSRKTTLIPQ